MDADQPGLFEVPSRAAPPGRRQRGRNREVWTLSATAQVTITDASTLRQAAARANESFVVTTPRADMGAEGSSLETSDAVSLDDPFDALAWLIWPTEGLERALDAGTLRVLSVESEAVAHSLNHGTATWRVTVKLTDVDELRRLATQAHPGEATEISDNLAIAWQRAADPFSPIRSIDGIAWTPGRVIVEHQPARPAGNR